jgi:hypothetical protein
VFCLLGYNTVQSVESQPTFRRNISLPSSGSKCLFSTSFMLVSSFANSSTRKMEPICSFESSAEFQRNTRHYIPEDGTLCREEFVCQGDMLLICILELQVSNPGWDTAYRD